MMKDFCGCPGSAMQDLREREEDTTEEMAPKRSELRQWPIQMHLIMPTAPYYEKADVLLTADCVAYALGGYHSDYLRGRSIAIACPKLDEGQEVYVEKVASWIDDADIKSLTVMIMQVPCCRGLVHIATKALEGAKRKIPVKVIVVGIKGDILSEEEIG
jgi:hypothetical protein